MKYYRSNCQCDKCKKTWTTIKRRTKQAPAICKFCSSSMTRVLSFWRVK